MTIPWKGDLLTLQARITKARKAAKITQAQAGALAGVCERTYRDWERGDRDIPAATLFRLAAALGIRVFNPQPEENRQDVAGLKVAA